MKKLAMTIMLVALAAALMPAAVEAGVRFARFAKNADKVDGFHAVGGGASVDRRSGKLVATNSQGTLPNDIIAKAPDSERLNGLSEDHFVHQCKAGAISVVAEVPAGVGGTWSEVDGYGGVLFVHRPGVPDHFCDQVLTNVRATRVSTGVYRVAALPGDDVVGVEPGCTPGEARTIAAIVTVRDERPLFATYSSFSCVGYSSALGHEVRIFDADGNPTDAAFTLAQLEAAIISTQ